MSATALMHTTAPITHFASSNTHNPAPIHTHHFPKHTQPYTNTHTTLHRCTHIHQHTQHYTNTHKACCCCCCCGCGVILCDHPCDLPRIRAHAPQRDHLRSDHLCALSARLDPPAHIPSVCAYSKAQVFPPYGTKGW